MTMTIVPDHDENDVDIMNARFDRLERAVFGEAGESPVARRARLSAGQMGLRDRLNQLRDKRTRLEADAFDKRFDGSPAHRQVHHGAAGAVEQAEIDACTTEIIRTEQQLRAVEAELEGCDGHHHP